MYPYATGKDILLKHCRHDLYFDVNVHGRITFHRRPQVVNATGCKLLV